MSCIACEQEPRRVNNIFRDEELRDKFENITGITVCQNIFICDDCSVTLIQAHIFKEKCIDVYERNIIKYESDPPDDLKMEESEILSVYDEEHLEISKDDSQILIQEEHLEDENSCEVKDPLNQQNSPESKAKRLRYTIKEKIEAVELAEQTSNRQAAKLLTIDESCIRKWKRQKEHFKKHNNLMLKTCKSKKFKLDDQQSSNDYCQVEDPDEEPAEREVGCEIHTEVVDVPMPDLYQQPVKEIRTRKSYSSSEKLQVIAFAEVTGNRQTSKIYNIDESCIRKWRQQKDMLIELNEERGTRRKPNLRFPEVEKRLKAYVIEKLEEGIVLKPSEIKTQARNIADELNEADFKGSSSYIFKFMERYHFQSARNKYAPRKIKKESMKTEQTEFHVEII